MATKALDAPHLVLSPSNRKKKPPPSPRPPSSTAKTPLMKQYLALKEQHTDEVLFFRLGDFYEMFFEDAEIVARVLGIALTSRANGDSSYAMAGFPYHALDRYLPRMIRAGYRVAICEQVEDPATVKGKRVVERQVTEVITPGTLTNEKLLEARQTNFLLALHRPRGRARTLGLAWFEASSGRFLVAEVSADRLGAELERIGPAEIIVAAGLQRAGEGEDPRRVNDQRLLALLQRSAPVATVPDWVFRRQGALEALTERFGVATLAGMGLSDQGAYVAAAHAALHYMAEVKPGFLDRLDRFGRGIELHHPEAHVCIDPATARCLELVQPLRGDARGGATLLSAVDRTVTAMGGRLLREWLLAPLRDVKRIRRRQQAIQSLLDAPAHHQALIEALKQVYDLERLAGRAASGQASPRDLAALRDSLGKLPAVRTAARAAAGRRSLLSDVARALQPLAPLHQHLTQALEERPAATAREGRIFQEGWSAELDRLRLIAQDAAETLKAFQRREAERTKIPSLKVGYNKVFGYYIEVTQAHRNKVPADYVRKQTLKHVERFLTPELKELEGEILSARERAEHTEAALLVELREEAAAAAATVLTSAVATATLDVLGSLATLARERGYVRPGLGDHARTGITQGRHPVLDLAEGHERFVPNDVALGGDAGTLHLITGPNMAGKSTYIRQVALLTLLAQTGSFLPCEAAEMGVVDRIFARVGSGDELAQGLSTFMVEMTETANILRHATDRSLVILDEVGRGTSTYDGVSLAWAIACHLHDELETRTLFATHYHELTGMAAIKAGVRNRNVAVEERAGEITFLHQIVPGSADRSYGIHVARLAGLPKTVLVQAQEILRALEAGTFDPAVEPRSRSQTQLALFDTVAEDPLRARLQKIDPLDTTPMEALQLLQELQDLT